MSIKKIIFILSIFVCAIIGSTFLLKPDGKTHNSNNEINENEKSPAINIYEPTPSPYYKICTDLTSIDFVYPYDITEENDYTTEDSFCATTEDGTLFWNPFEYKTFYKSYGRNNFIALDILCFDKDATNDGASHYYEESSEEMLAMLLTNGDNYIDPLNDDPAVYSTKAENDFVAYNSCYEANESNPKYYFYRYISPGDPEIRAYIQYPEDFREQFDLYIAEFEKTIKKK